MKTVKALSTIVAVFAIAVLSVFTSVPSAHAQSNPYAVLCVTNNTDARITYSYRWGSGSWKSSTLDSGDTDRHWWVFESGSTLAPMFKIQFDADTTSDNLTYRYDLDRYQAPTKSCGWGKNYAFERKSWWQIDLYTKD